MLQTFLQPMMELALAVTHIMETTDELIHAHLLAHNSDLNISSKVN